MKPRAMDLFCGAGGVSTGLRRAGFEVVGVDLEPRPSYPFEFHRADALEFPLDGFDFYAASPPCQAWTAYGRRPNHVAARPKLIAAIRERLIATGKPFAIEGVGGARADLRDPVLLCGSMFGLDVRRQRIPLDVQRRAMGIDWMTLEELSQAIPPAYAEHVGRAFFAQNGAAPVSTGLAAAPGSATDGSSPPGRILSERTSM